VSVIGIDRPDPKAVTDHLTKDDIKVVKYRCPCGIALTVSILPWSPQLAKHHCFHCGRTNEIATREESMNAIEEGAEINKDHMKVAKRHSVSFDQSKWRKTVKRSIHESDLALVKSKLAATKFGDAYLIEK
jgi:hypothetical protein